MIDKPNRKLKCPGCGKVSYFSNTTWGEVCFNCGFVLKYVKLTWSGVEG